MNAAPPDRLRAAYDWVDQSAGELAKLEGLEGVALGNYCRDASALAAEHLTEIAPDDFFNLSQWLKGHGGGALGRLTAEISAAAAEVRGILRAARAPGRSGLTMAEIGRRTMLRRPALLGALAELDAAAMVTSCHGRGGVGSELWRALTELERVARLAGRERDAALDRHLGAGCEVHAGSVAALLRLPADERERIAALCDAYDSAWDAAWAEDGGSLRPDAPEVKP